jgi:hypothetical protein
MLGGRGRIEILRSIQCERSEIVTTQRGNKMTPEKKFKKWFYEEYTAHWEDVPNSDPVEARMLKAAFLAGYEQGYGQGNHDGYREGTGWDE